MTGITSREIPHGGAVALALMAALMWGLWWMPIRYLEAAGLGGAWAGIMMNIGALPLLAGIALTHRGTGRISRRAVGGAILIGVAVTLYASALTFTDVVRAVLLFYLAPTWSTAIECVFLGRRWTWRNTLALGLSFAGVLIIFRGGFAADGWNGGDLMALASGIAWSTGAAMIFTASPASARQLALATCLGAVLVGASVLIVGGDQAGVLAPRIDIGLLAVLIVASGTLYLAPIVIITMWGARRLAPALFSFLLTAEILSGVISSAVFLDERFGWLEVLGAVLVALGVIVEILTAPKQQQST